MTLMIVGLVAFLGLHVLPTAPHLRHAVVLKLGDNRYARRSRSARRSGSC